LIIGLNSDCSIKKLKGPDRPIIDENNRALVLSALEIVDFVVIFDEETPYNLIKKIKPDILVKGGDWKISEIVGSDVVLNNGGEVRSLNFREGISTTRIIEKIRESKF
nr:D-glycero-beta-D-manno-heptose 1-phosphate adenylyltransferase [Candidatus Cloacimonadota bacterium]